MAESADFKRYRELLKKQSGGLPGAKNQRTKKEEAELTRLSQKFGEGSREKRFLDLTAKARSQQNRISKEEKAELVALAEDLGATDDFVVKGIINRATEADKKAAESMSTQLAKEQEAAVKAKDSRAMALSAFQGGKIDSTQLGATLAAAAGRTASPEAKLWASANTVYLNREVALQPTIQDARDQARMDKAAQMFERGQISEEEYARMVGAPRPSHHFTQQAYDPKEAIALPLSWSDKEKQEFVSKGIAYNATYKGEGGVRKFEPGMSDQDIQDAWEALMEESVKYNAMKNTPMGKQGLKATPWDMLELKKRPDAGTRGYKTEGGWKIDQATGERVEWVGGSTAPEMRKISTGAKVDLSDPGEVKVLAYDLVRQLLGRAPTEAELGQFKTSLNTYEEKHPLTTTSVEEYVPDKEAESGIRMGHQDLTEIGGVTDEARKLELREQVRQKPEYARYQAATSGWNVLMRMINGG